MPRKKSNRGRNRRRKRQEPEPVAAQPRQAIQGDEVVAHFHDILAGANRLVGSGINLLNSSEEFERQELEFAEACLDLVRSLADAGCPMLSRTLEETPIVLQELWQTAVDDQWDRDEDDEEEETEPADVEMLRGGDSDDADTRSAVHGKLRPVDTADGESG